MFLSGSEEWLIFTHFEVKSHYFGVIFTLFGVQIITLFLE